jgi:TPR repeat protein
VYNSLAPEYDSEEDEEAVTVKGKARGHAAKSRGGAAPAGDAASAASAGTTGEGGKPQCLVLVGQAIDAFVGDKGQPKDEKKALQLAEEALEEGLEDMAYGDEHPDNVRADALYHLAGLYNAGLSFTKDEEKAIELVKQAAELGNVEALCELSMVADGVEEIEEMLRRAVAIEPKSGVANSSLGRHLLSQAQTDPSLTMERRKELIQESVKRLEVAANQDDAEACSQLGELLWQGKSVRRDLGMAATCFSKATKKQHPHGIYRLGLMMMEGEGVSTGPDPLKGIELIKMAAALEYLPAVTALGEFLLTGVKVSEAAARSAGKPSAAGQYIVQPNPQQAVGLLTNAAQGGEKQAIFQLGVIMLNQPSEGEDLPPRDDSKAVQLIQQAAKLGCIPACTTLGMFYLKGFPFEPVEGQAMVIRPDLQQCVQMWKIATQAGDAQAKAHLGSLYHASKDQPQVIEMLHAMGIRPNQTAAAAATTEALTQPE